MVYGFGDLPSFQNPPYWLLAIRLTYPLDPFILLSPPNLHLICRSIEFDDLPMWNSQKLPGLVITNSLPWYRCSIEKDDLPFLKMVIFLGYVKFPEVSLSRSTRCGCSQWQQWLFSALEEGNGLTRHLIQPRLGYWRRFLKMEVIEKTTQCQRKSDQENNAFGNF